MKKLSTILLFAMVGIIQAQSYVGIYVKASQTLATEKENLEKSVSSQLPPRVEMFSKEKLLQILDSKFTEKLYTASINEDLQKILRKEKVHVLILVWISKKENGYVAFMRILPVEKKQEVEVISLDNTYVTTVDLKYSTDLDKGQISKDMEKVFQNKKLSLSAKTTVKIHTKNQKWLLSGSEDKQRYSVTKGKKGLEIYLDRIYSFDEIVQPMLQLMKKSKILAGIPIPEKPTAKPDPTTKQPVATEPEKRPIKPIAEPEKQPATEPEEQPIKPVATEPEKQPIKPNQPTSEETTKGWFGEQMPSYMRRTTISGFYIWEKDDSIMVYIQAGKFDYKNAETWQQYDLPAYYIDKYEVTNAQYCQFLNDVARKDEGGNIYLDIKVPQPKTDDGKALFLVDSIDIYSPYCGIIREDDVFKPKTGAENYPVVKVSWYGASLYASWASKMLPSELQWEKACRGGMSIPNALQTLQPMDNPTPRRTYPWGDEAPNYLFARVNYKSEDDGYKWLSPVKALDGLGDSPYGCSNMSGNVWEWCQDSFYPRSKFGEFDPSVSTVQACRGGSWGSEDFSALECSARCGVYAKETHNDLGFRCVVIVK